MSWEDRRVLHGSMELLVLTWPRLAEQVVAACADPDPRIAFAALDCTKMLLADGEDRASSHMLRSGAVPAVMSALKHSHASCRAAAASVIAGENYVVENDVGRSTIVVCASIASLRALQETGLVPALLDIVRAGRCDDVQGPRTGVFSNITVDVVVGDKTVTLPNHEPALHACNALAALTRTRNALKDLDPQKAVFGAFVVAELVKTRHTAAALVACLRQFQGDLAVPPGQLIEHVVAFAYVLAPQHLRTLGLRDGQKRVFFEELLKAGLPDLLASLIRPGQPEVSLVMLGILLGICHAPDFDSLPSKSLAAALVKYMEEGPAASFSRRGARQWYVC